MSRNGSYERSGVVIDQCGECRGIFLDRGELEKLFEIVRRLATQAYRGVGLFKTPLPLRIIASYPSWDRFVFMIHPHLGFIVMTAGVALMTVEGENDDISGLGQTEATHALVGPSGADLERRRSAAQRVSS